MDTKKNVIKLLNSYNFEAWFCGGTARDIYIGKEPLNYDIAVQATLTELRDKLATRITTINEYGTFITVDFKDTIFYIYPLKKIELVNTYYNFAFTNSLYEDSSTRDFTINSLYYNPLTGIWVDNHNGKKDIQNKCIKFVGDGITRILESKVRLLRAAALATTLGESWYIDISSINAIKSEKLKLLTVNSKQINKEITKVFLYSKNPSKFFYLLKELELLKDFFPELYNCINVEQTNKNNNLNLFQHIMLALDAVPNSLNKDKLLLLRVAALLHDIGKPYTKTYDNGNMHFYQHEYVGAYIAEKILYRWGFDKHFINQVLNLITNHLFDANPNRALSSIKKLIYKVGTSNIHDLIELRAADRKGNHRVMDMTQLNKFSKKVNRILEQESPDDFILDVDVNKLKELLTPLTSRLDITLEALQKHLRMLITIKKLQNKQTKILTYTKNLLSIKCPLDVVFLIKTWSEIYKDTADKFQNGNLKCGIYCNFTCNTILNKNGP